MNMLGIESLDLAEKAGQLLRLLGQAERLSILLAIGEGEACVCHLEAVFGLRQAHISQQLMVLRDAGLVTDRRDGWNIFTGWSGRKSTW